MLCTVSIVARASAISIIAVFHFNANLPKLSCYSFLQKSCYKSPHFCPDKSLSIAITFFNRCNAIFLLSSIVLLQCFNRCFVAMFQSLFCCNGSPLVLFKISLPYFLSLVLFKSMWCWLVTFSLYAQEIDPSN